MFADHSGSLGPPAAAGRRALPFDGERGAALEPHGCESGSPVGSDGDLVHAPAPMAGMHRGYPYAGAELWTANPFRTPARTRAAAGP